MMENETISNFAGALLFLIGATIFVVGGYVFTSLIRPKRPNEEKLSLYECGEEPISRTWGQFNIRFYIIAIIFILFDVELIFLFPWATIFGNAELIQQTDRLWGWMMWIEMFIFVGILFLGLLYAWKNGFLNWSKPQAKPTKFISKIPSEMYQKFNQNY